MNYSLHEKKIYKRGHTWILRSPKPITKCRYAMWLMSIENDMEKFGWTREQRGK